MNYRHIYHAGNFCDVLKHAALALVIEHLKLKPQPFRVIDTHAGVGTYALASEEASKTGEWRDGIGRLIGEPLPEDVERLLAPYLDVVRAANEVGSLDVYPGSPCIARRLMRDGDRLVVNELHPEDAEQLAALFARDPQTKVLSLDAWTALKALLPPKERRGVVLIDAPFEETGEFDRLVEGLREGVRRFATGTYLLWYPIKDLRAVSQFKRGLLETGIPKIFMVEVAVGDVHAAENLVATGLAVVNPPFTLPGALERIGTFLSERLLRDDAARCEVTWLAPDVITRV